MENTTYLKHLMIYNIRFRYGKLASSTYHNTHTLKFFLPTSYLWNFETSIPAEQPSDSKVNSMLQTGEVSLLISPFFTLQFPSHLFSIFKTIRVLGFLHLNFCHAVFFIYTPGNVCRIILGQLCFNISSVQ